MSQVAGDGIRGLIVILFIMLIAGCSSTPNDQSLLNPDTGKHAANWNVDHQAAFLSNPSQCTECHGTDFRGGISNVSCFSTDVNGMSCHSNGPSGHTADWATPGSHGASAKSTPSTSAMKGFSTCQICHGTDLAGGFTLKTCLNTAGCHGATIGAPHSPAPWRGGARTHTNTYITNAGVCGLCHLGNKTPPSYAPLPAGAQPGCFNSTLCHANTAAPHPVPYTDAALHGPAAKTDLTYCQGCHANPPTSGAGSNPRFNVGIGSLANGCEDCHEINTAHPVPWSGTLPLVIATSHSTAANMLNACALCHGATLGGGPIAPACTSCHTAGSPLSFTNCTSCHGNPPDGTASPNIAGQHAVHVGLGSYVICNTCHNGAGTGTLNHDYVGGVVNVAFLSAYSASSGAASFDATTNTCTNVSCHGGSRTQTAAQAGLTPPDSTVTQTPSWLTGAINVNTDCVVCHVLGSAAGSPENNSYYSGEHLFHFYTLLYPCTMCHDAVDPLKLAANHFTHLDTAVMEGPASATIVSSLTLTYTPGNTPGTGTCVATCHASPTVPRNW